MTTPTSAEPKPDCARCGQPYHRHNIGSMTTCPIIATYTPLRERCASEQSEGMVRSVAEALALRWIERSYARGCAVGYKNLADMPGSYSDDFYEDARAALAAVDG